MPPITGAMIGAKRHDRADQRHFPPGPRAGIKIAHDRPATARCRRSRRPPAQRVPAINISTELANAQTSVATLNRSRGRPSAPACGRTGRRLGHKRSGQSQSRPDTTEMVSCTCAWLAVSSRAMSGSDGRYMSVESGPMPVSAASSAVSAKVLARSTRQVQRLHALPSAVAVQLGAMRVEPGLGPVEVGIKPLHQPPEPRRMVHLDADAQLRAWRDSRARSGGAG